jgi:protein-S-isoprenylcysteine O-methyltransferase Ste14
VRGVSISVGKRGEGWFLIQLALFVLILASSRIGLWVFPAWLRVLGGVLLVIGGIAGTLGIFALGRNLSPFPKPIEGGSLVTNGVYGIVRHPIYTGLILGTLGWGLLMSSVLGVILAVVLFLFFDRKSRHEEAWLLETYPGYAEYRDRVKKLLPGIY